MHYGDCTAPKMHYVYSVNFQYKSPKTTYDLYAGQRFTTQGIAFYGGDLYAGATYTRVYTVIQNKNMVWIFVEVFIGLNHQ